MGDRLGIPRALSILFFFWIFFNLGTGFGISGPGYPRKSKKIEKKKFQKKKVDLAANVVAASI